MGTFQEFLGEGAEVGIKESAAAKLIGNFEES